VKKGITAIIIGVASIAGATVVSCGWFEKKDVENQVEIEEVSTENVEKPDSTSAKNNSDDTVSMDGASAVLEVFGWSENSEYFAFGQWGRRNDPIDIENQGFADYWLVDVDRDEFVSDAGVSICCSEAEPVLPEDIRKARLRFTEGIEDYGVKGNLPGERVELKTEESTEGKELKEFGTEVGNSYQMVLTKEFRFDKYPVEGRFGLAIINEETGEKTYLQRMGKFYPGRLDYSIHRAYVDPGGEWIAVIILKTMYGFEGDRIPEFMVNTGRLP
jgi:predicted secreted protein